MITKFAVARANPKTAAAVVKLLVNRRVGASELEITFVDKVCVIEMLSAL